MSETCGVCCGAVPGGVVSTGHTALCAEVIRAERDGIRAERDTLREAAKELCAKLVEVADKLRSEQTKWEALRQWVNDQNIPVLCDTSILTKMSGLDGS